MRRTGGSGISTSISDGHSTESAQCSVPPT